MADDQSAFWSKVAEKYDRVVDLQIGPATRSMVRDRLSREGALGHLAEFGCGSGFFTSVLAGKADPVVATDLAPGMLELARRRTGAANVRFQCEDCQHTTLPTGTFDTAFMSLVLHFTEPAKTLAEMHRILKPGGTLIIANIDAGVLKGLDLLRCRMRVFFHGITGYRTKPPKNFAKGLITTGNLCDLLKNTGFTVLSTERIRDTSRSSNIPLAYTRAAKGC